MSQTKARESISQNTYQNQSPEGLKGKLLYSIHIPQLGIIVSGLLESTDIADWILLDYIRHWQANHKAKATTKDEKRFIWMNYTHLLQSLPILQYFKIHSKQPISRRFKKLEKLGLIEIFRARDNTIFARLTEKALSVYYVKVENFESSQDDPVLPIGEYPVPPIGEHPIPLREEQHNSKSVIDNPNKKSFIKRESFFNSIRENEKENNHSSNSSTNREKIGSLTKDAPPEQAKEILSSLYESYSKIWIFI